MTDYNDIEKLTGNTVRYTASENGIGIFKSTPKNIIVSSAVAIRMNDDTVLELPLKKGDTVKSLFPIELFRFISAQEYEQTFEEFDKLKENKEID